MMFGFHAQALADVAKYGGGGVCVLCGLTWPTGLTRAKLDLGPTHGVVDIHVTCGNKCPDTERISLLAYRWKGQE